MVFHNDIMLVMVYVVVFVSFILGRIIYLFRNTSGEDKSCRWCGSWGINRNSMDDSF